MNIEILIANILAFLTFFLHTIGGDREYKSIEPEKNNVSMLQKWIMGRAAFHIVSADLLLATIGLSLVNFTGYFYDEKQILNILSVYFFTYGSAFLITLTISNKFKNSFIKLWQWLLMFLISGLIYFGTN